MNKEQSKINLWDYFITDPEFNEKLAREMREKLEESGRKKVGIMEKQPEKRRSPVLPVCPA